MVRRFILNLHKNYFKAAIFGVISQLRNEKRGTDVEILLRSLPTQIKIQLSLGSLLSFIFYFCLKKGQKIIFFLIFRNI